MMSVVLCSVMGNKPYQPDRFTQVLAPAEILHAENEQLKHLVSACFTGTNSQDDFTES